MPRNALANGVVLLASSLVALLVFEAAGRVLFRDQARAIRDVNHRPQPDTATNGDGLRSKVEPGEVRPEDVSVLWGPYLPPEATVPQQLERERGVPYLSLLPAFERATEFPLYFEGDPHWNEAGSRVAAEAILRFCLDQGCFVGEKRRSSAGRSVPRPSSSRTARAATIPDPSAVPVDATDGKVR